MAAPAQDQWAEWLLRRRHGDDAHEQQAMLRTLYRYRDVVLAHAQVAAGDTLLDVGAGDGLIAFGALPLVGESGRVIMSDVSRDVLDRCRALAEQMGELSRCEFLKASADDLSPVVAASVDVVTTRSVLIFVASKQQALGEFHRVLRAGGRLSFFEPINRFCYPEPEHHLWGYDATPVRHLTQRVRAVYDRVQPPATNPMLDFDEHDLLTWTEQAGFARIHMEVQFKIEPLSSANWDSWLRKAGNPKIPTREEALRIALAPDEIAELTHYLRPLVEQGQGTAREAVAYLWATKQAP
jgi:ubiquinone/menaquinone biosynthesis C-methylase UbiE